MRILGLTGLGFERGEGRGGEGRGGEGRWGSGIRVESCSRASSVQGCLECGIGVSDGEHDRISSAYQFAELADQC